MPRLHLVNLHPAASSCVRSLCCTLLAALVCAAGAATARAQEEEKLKPPEDVELVTKDGIELKTTFFPGNKGKDSVPVILLHSFKGNRNDMAPLAAYLQKTYGHAVILPDLRGHGDSTTRGGDKPKTLEADAMPILEFPQMVFQDMETVKKYLVERNNEGELNIDKLCIVGAEMGASVGMLWTQWDWHWPDLSTGKQGKDVKAVVLISPDVGFKNLNMQAIASDPLVRKDVSIYIAVGAGSPSAVTDAKHVYNLFKPFHRFEKKEDRDLFFDDTFQTKLQGAKLLNEETLGLPERIGQFIEARAANQAFPWKDRKSPI